MIKTVGAFFARYPRLLSGLTGGMTFAMGDVIAQCIESPKSIGIMGTLGILKHEMVSQPKKHDNAGSEFIDLENMSIKEFIVDTVDVGRVARTAVYGSVMNGLVLYQWFKVVDIVFGSAMAKTRIVALKMLADQIVYAPFSITVYFGVNSFKFVSPTKQQQAPLQKLNRTPQSQHQETTKSRDQLSLPVSFKFNDFKSKMSDSFWTTYLADWTVWPAFNAINFRFVPLYMRPTFVCVAQLCWGTYLSTVANKDRLKQALLSKNSEEATAEKLV